MREGERQRRASYRLLLTTLWATLLVLAIEATAGWASQSLCLLAESLHTLIDGFSTVLSLIAVSSPQRTLGREIWGHGRAEVASTLILVACLGFTGVTLLLVAMQQMESAVRGDTFPFPVNMQIQVIQLVAAMILVSLGLAVYSGHQSRFLSSLALRLNAQHMLQDAWLTIALVVGLVGIWRGYRWLDPVFAIALVLFSIRSVWRVLNTQLPMLLRPTAIAPEAIAELVTQVEGVTRCTRILSRGMVGRQVWIEIHLVLHPEFMDITQLIGEEIEGALRERYGPVRTQIWVDEAALHPTAYPTFDTHPNTEFSQESDWN